MDRFETISRNPGLARTVLTEVLQNDELRRVTEVVWRQHIWRPMLEGLHELQKKGAIRKDVDVEVLARAIHCLHVGYFFTRYVFWRTVRGMTRARSTRWRISSRGEPAAKRDGGCRLRSSGGVNCGAGGAAGSAGFAEALGLDPAEEARRADDRALVRAFADRLAIIEALDAKAELAALHGDQLDLGPDAGRPASPPRVVADVARLPVLEIVSGLYFVADLRSTTWRSTLAALPGSHAATVPNSSGAALS